MTFGISSSSLIKAAKYVCYATETTLPVVAAYTGKSSFAYANLPFAALGTVFYCLRMTNTNPTPGLHNLAYIVGLGTSIAAAAVNTGSAALQMLSAVTAGCFAGNIFCEYLDEKGQPQARVAREEPHSLAPSAELTIEDGQNQQPAQEPAAQLEFGVVDGFTYPCAPAA